MPVDNANQEITGSPSSPDTFVNVEADPLQRQPAVGPMVSDTIQITQEQKGRLEAELAEKFKEWADSRRPLEARWLKNAAIAAGQQYMDWNKARAYLEYQEPETEKAIRGVVNRVLGKRRSIVSRMVNNLPLARVKPQSSDLADVNAARLGTDLLKYDYNKNEVDNVIRMLANYVVDYGSAYVKCVWDPYKGDLYVQHKEEPVMTHQMGLDGQPMMDESGQPVMAPQVGPDGQPLTQKVMGPDGQPIVQDQWNEGDVCKYPISPLEIYYDRAFNRFEDADEVIHRTFNALNWVKRTIPNCDDVKPVDASTLDQTYDMIYNHTGFRYGNTQKKGVIVKDYWCKKTEEFPHGLHLVIVDEKIRVAEPIDVLDGDELPFDKVRYIQHPADPDEGMGLPEILEFTQQFYNKTICQIIENAGDTLNVKTYQSLATQIVDVTTDRAGQRITHRGPKPVTENPPQLPQALFNLLSSLLNDFDDLSGVPRSAEGQIDKSINSQDQLDAYVEASKAKHGPEIDSFLKGIEKFERKTLMYYQAKVSEERMIRIEGQDGRIWARMFKGSDLKGATDVVMARSSMMSQSRNATVAEMKMFFDLWGSAAGDAMGPEERKAMVKNFMERLHYGEDEAFMNDINPQEGEAKRMIQDVAFNGMEGVLLPWHNPAVFKGAIEDFLNSADMDSLDPQSKDRMVQFWQRVTDTINSMAPPPMPGLPGPPTGAPSSGAPPTGPAGGAPKPTNPTPMKPGPAYPSPPKESDEMNQGAP